MLYMCEIYMWKNQILYLTKKPKNYGDDKTSAMQSVLRKNYSMRNELEMKILNRIFLTGSLFEILRNISFDEMLLYGN